MGKIIIEINESVSKEGFKCFDTQSTINAKCYEAMVGIATLLCDIESELPDADKQRFRSDFLQILNETRNGEHDA